MAGSSAIKHNSEFLQKVDFEGMDYLLRGRRVVPLSDIDGLIDAEGKGWILYELKYNDADLPTGQRILFEHMINDLSIARPAVCFVCSHGIKDANRNIILKDAFVTSVYSSPFGWKYYGRDYSQRWTAKELTDIFLKRYAPDMLNQT